MSNTEIMRNKLIYVCLFVLLAATSSFAYQTGPDPASNGVFGQAACNAAGCHTGNPLNAAGGTLTLTGLPPNWTPGQTYPLTVTISRAGAVKYGFQLSAVTSSNTQAGSFAAGTGNSKVSVCGAGASNCPSIPSTSVQYAQHNFLTTSSPPFTGIFTVNWTAPANAGTGAVRFNLAANAANGDVSNQGDFIYTRVDTVNPATTAPPPPPPPVVQTFYYPQIANGIQTDGVFWKTTIFLYNPSQTATASGLVTFTKSNGSAFPVTFVNSAGQPSSGNTISFTLGPGVSQKYVSNGAGALDVGFATVTSSEIINGTAIFSEFAPNGALLGEAGVPAADAIARQSIFVDTLAGFKTGVAYANPSSSPATVTLQLFNSAGAAVQAASTITLGPGQHTAQYIGLPNQLFPTAPAFVGTMQITSSSPLAVIALRFDPSFAHFTTLPPVTLASVFREILSPLAWLERFVEDKLDAFAARTRSS